MPYASATMCASAMSPVHARMRTCLCVSAVDDPCGSEAIRRASCAPPLTTSCDQPRGSNKHKASFSPAVMLPRLGSGGRGTLYAILAISALELSLRRLGSTPGPVYVLALRISGIPSTPSRHRDSPEAWVAFHAALVGMEVDLLSEGLPLPMALPSAAPPPTGVVERLRLATSVVLATLARIRPEGLLLADPFSA